MEKENFKVESQKLNMFTGRTTDVPMRPVVFENKKRKAELSRQNWKKETKEFL